MRKLRNGSKTWTLISPAGVGWCSFCLYIYLRSIRCVRATGQGSVHGEDYRGKHRRASDNNREPPGFYPVLACAKAAFAKVYPSGAARLCKGPITLQVYHPQHVGGKLARLSSPLPCPILPLRICVVVMISSELFLCVL